MKIIKELKRLSILYLLIISALLFINVIPSFATDNLQYYYDNLNRLVCIMNNATGNVVEYQYDEVGNRTNKGIMSAYTITATAGSNGSISPAGSTLLPPGYNIMAH